MARVGLCSGVYLTLSDKVCLCSRVSRTLSDKGWSVLLCVSYIEWQGLVYVLVCILQ